MTMHLAGVPVKDEFVLELAGMVDDEALAAKLEDATGRVRVLALTIAEREAILAVLEDPPEGLNELRGALIRDHEQRNSA